VSQIKKKIRSYRILWNNQAVVVDAAVTPKGVSVFSYHPVNEREPRTDLDSNWAPTHDGDHSSALSAWLSEDREKLYELIREAHMVGSHS